MKKTLQNMLIISLFLSALAVSAEFTKKEFVSYVDALQKVALENVGIRHNSIQAYSLLGTQNKLTKYALSHSAYIKGSWSLEYITRVDEETLDNINAEFSDRREELKAKWCEALRVRAWPTDPDTGNAMHAHHIIPKQYGGLNVWWNLVPLTEKQHTFVHHSWPLGMKIFPMHQRPMFTSEDFEQYIAILQSIALKNIGVNQKRLSVKSRSFLHEINTKLFDSIKYANYIKGEDLLFFSPISDKIQKDNQCKFRKNCYSLTEKWGQQFGRNWPTNYVYHIIPLQYGGSNVWWNLIPVTKEQAEIIQNDPLTQRIFPKVK